MTKQRNFKPLGLAVGVALAASAAGISSANAGDNPFGMTQLSAGYMVAGNEGKCGEGKCGEGKDKLQAQDMGKKGEGKCGEGKCGK